MKSIIKVFFTVVFLINVVGCNSSDDKSSSTTQDQNIQQQSINEKDSIKKEVEASKPGPFKDGKFGRIDLDDSKYDSLARDEGSKVVDGATFIDIRNLWEREYIGQPKEVISDVIVYQIREDNGHGSEIQGHRKLNKDFVKEVLKAVGGDKNKKIVLICHSGSRSSAAAKLLSENGFTNVYDIKGGFNAWEDKFETTSYSQAYR